jgi:hypothetical protein
VEGSCEHGDDPSGSIKCWEIPEWLSDLWLLNMLPASVFWVHTEDGGNF